VGKWNRGTILVESIILSPLRGFRMGWWVEVRGLTPPAKKLMAPSGLGGRGTIRSEKGEKMERIRQPEG